MSPKRCRCCVAGCINPHSSLSIYSRHLRQTLKTWWNYFVFKENAPSTLPKFVYVLTHILCCVYSALTVIFWSKTDASSFVWCTINFTTLICIFLIIIRTWSETAYFTVVCKLVCSGCIQADDKYVITVIKLNYTCSISIQHSDSVGIIVRLRVEMNTVTESFWYYHHPVRWNCPETERELMKLRPLCRAAAAYLHLKGTHQKVTI